MVPSNLFPIKPKTISIWVYLSSPGSKRRAPYQREPILGAFGRGAYALEPELLTQQDPYPQEMDLLEPTDVVFKLIGPALIRQDTAEAQASVNKRLDYIKGEMWVPASFVIRQAKIDTMRLACYFLDQPSDFVAAISC